MKLLRVFSCKGLISGLIVLIALACGKEKRPVFVLSEEEMARVMMEIYISEEKINRLNLRRDSAEKIFGEASPIIFARVGVPDSVFKKSYEYYFNRPKDLERIYTSIVDSLNLREQQLVVKSVISQ
jgi:hypothetical protein